MDPEIWEHLADNEEILRLVLARLPWNAILRLRCVSKAWNGMLSEPSFLTWAFVLGDGSFYSSHRALRWVKSSLTHAGHPSDGLAFGTSSAGRMVNPVCVLSTNCHTTVCALADFELCRWFKLPPLMDLPFQRWNEFTILGATEGILLLESNMRGDPYQLDRYLVNPITKMYSKLPPIPRVGRFAREISRLFHPISLTVDKDNTIRVVAAEFSHRGGGLASTEIERILIWQPHSSGWEPLQADAARLSSVRTIEHAVFAGGELFVHTSYRMDLRHGHRIVRCSGQGVNLEVEMDFGEFTILYLFQHRGDLMCVVSTPAVRNSQGITLCRFDHGAYRWATDSLVHMPSEMARSLYESIAYSGLWRIYVDAEGDTLCIGNRFDAKTFFLYDLVSEEWSESPSIKEYEHQSSSRQNVFLWSPRK